MKHRNAIMMGAVVAALVGVTVMWSQQKAHSNAATSKTASSSAHASGLVWGSPKRTEIVDPQYQMTAYTFDIPSNWKFAGAMVRPGGCHSNGVALKYTLQSPDGQYAMVVLPGVTWTWSTSQQAQKMMEMSHCPGININSASSFLINIAVPNLHPAAKIVEVLPLLPAGQAALAQQLEQMKQQNAKMAASYGMPPQEQSLDGARVRIQYDRDGQPVEEMVVSVVQCFVSKERAMFNQPASDKRICTSRGTTLMRAPAGKLDAFINLPQTKEIGKGLQVNDAWQSRVAQDRQAAFNKMESANNAQFQANLKANQAQFDQRMREQKQFDANLRASTDRALAQDRAQQAAIDESAHRTALYSLDRQDFKNPNTGETIEASSQYNHQWISSDGSTLIQTNDHSYDPNGQVYPVSQSWSELVPK